METATVARFQQVDSAPVVSLRGSPDDADGFRQRLESYGATVRLLRGPRMKTVGALFVEVAVAVGCPDPSGADWGALEECLTRFEGQDAGSYVLLVTEAAQLLARAPEEELETFLDLLEDVAAAGQDRAGPATPGKGRSVAFHVGFQERSESISGLVARLASAGVDPEYLALPGQGGA